MKKDKFLNLVDELLKESTDVFSKKSVEYQKGENVFSNFEENAKDIGLSKYQVWSIYFNKHIRSILNAIKSNPNNPDENLVEPLKSRIIDIIVYLLLLYGMLNDKK